MGGCLYVVTESGGIARGKGDKGDGKSDMERRLLLRGS